VRDADRCTSVGGHARAVTFGLAEQMANESASRAASKVAVRQCRPRAQHSVLLAICGHESNDFTHAH
jgi:hypothetical protein